MLLFSKAKCVSRYGHFPITIEYAIHYARAVSNITTVVFDADDALIAVGYVAVLL